MWWGLLVRAVLPVRGLPGPGLGLPVRAVLPGLGLPVQ